MARKKKQLKAKPFPEAIDGRPWQIRESPTPREAGVGESTMLVPLGTDLRERAVRLHEMLHVKITPALAIREAAEEHNLPEDILQNCEDARVHGHARRIGFKDEINALEGVISDFELNQVVQHAGLTQVAALGAAMTNTGEFDRLSAKLSESNNEEKDLAFHAGKRIAVSVMHDPRELPTFDETVAMCAKIVELFGDPGRPEQPAVTDVVSAKQVAQAVAELAPKGQLEKLTIKPAQEPTQKGGSEPHKDEVGWRRMEVVEPPLTVKLPQQMRFKSRKIPEAYGRRLRRVGRLHHDGRVFARKIRKSGGGAVLIDVSGSMKLEAHDVLQLMEKFPGGVIATYCGNKLGHVGWLTVIARNGKHCEEHLMTPRGGYNAIDGPALEWIGKHPGPRFWISDALVHGGAIGLAYCLRVCGRFNIQRVDNAWEILGRPS